MNQELVATYTVNVGNGETVEMTGNPDRLDEITALMRLAELDADPWTHIVAGNEATLPPTSTHAQVAIINSAGDKQVVEAWRSGELWVDAGGDAACGDDWRDYAWQPWPEAPEVRGTDEQ